MRETENLVLSKLNVRKFGKHEGRKTSKLEFNNILKIWKGLGKKFENGAVQNMLILGIRKVGNSRFGN